MGGPCKGLHSGPKVEGRAEWKNLNLRSWPKAEKPELIILLRPDFLLNRGCVQCWETAPAVWECREPGGGLSPGCQSHPPPPPPALRVSWGTRDPSQLKKKNPKNPKENTAEELSEQGEGRRSCQMVASPAGGSARVAGTGGDTMETFRLAAHMRQGRTERSLSLPAAGGICCSLLPWFVLPASRVEMLFPFNLHPPASWMSVPFPKHMAHPSGT